jgi:hypothetical protein
MRFYAALHYVQAYFASGTGKAPTTHYRRANSIQRDMSIAGAYDDYRYLEDLSRDVRYNYSNLQPGHIKFAEDCLITVKSVVGLHL